MPSPSVPTESPPRHAVPPPVERSPLPLAGDAGHRSAPHRDRLPAWLVSTIVHAAALLVLALAPVVAGMGHRRVIEVRLPASDAHRPQALQRMEVAEERRTAAEDAAERERAPVAIDALAAMGELPLGPIALEEDDPAGRDERLPIGGRPDEGRLTALPRTGLDGRRPEQRAELVERFGGTPESERAVEEALRWLAAHQQNNGGWSFDLAAAPCEGRCSDGPRNPLDLPLPPTAATGLALLPFLGAGYTHREGPYQEEVRRGLYYLQGKIRPATRGGDLRYGSMYGHGIAALALCEAFAMTGDEDLRPAVRDVLEYIAAAQHQRGGWRYEPGEAGDMTVTGWQVMALKSGTLAGIPIHSLTRERAEAFLLSLSDDGGSRFGYRGPGESPTCTAIGLLLRMYFGYGPDQPETRRGLYWVAGQSPSESDLYFNYYATLALHHARHPEWTRVNGRLRDRLVAAQATSGHERGSWHFDDPHGNTGGRLYSTAMAALILEVYYRYLPLYAAGDEDFPL